MHTYIQAGIHIDRQIYIHAYWQPVIHTDIYTGNQDIHTYTHTGGHTDRRTHIDRHTYMHTHIHIHPDSQAGRQAGR